MTPISRKKRAFYLILSALLVVVGSPILIFYAQGYRLSDLGDFAFRETGGIYVSAGISGVSVLIDGKEKDQTSFISHGILVQNLVDDTYRVEAFKKGYFEVGKDLTVYPSIVTEWRPLLIPNPVPLIEIPEYLSSKSTSTPSTPIPLVKNQERVDALKLFAPATSTLKVGATSTLVSKDTELANILLKSDLKVLVKEKTLRRSGDFISWIDNSGSIRFMWIGEKESTPQYLCSPDGCKKEEVIKLPTAVLWMDFLPNRNDILVATTPTGAYLVEVDGRGGRTIIPISEEPGVEMRIFEEKIYIKSGNNIEGVKL